MPRLSATLRASWTLSRLQHLLVEPSPGLVSAHSRIMIPIQLYPCSTKSAAAKELSTPPLMATTTVISLGGRWCLAARSGRCAGAGSAGELVKVSAVKSSILMPVIVPDAAACGYNCHNVNGNFYCVRAAPVLPGISLLAGRVHLVPGERADIVVAQ